MGSYAAGFNKSGDLWIIWKDMTIVKKKVYWFLNGIWKEIYQPFLIYANTINTFIAIGKKTPNVSSKNKHIKMLNILELPKAGRFLVIFLKSFQIHNLQKQHLYQ